MPRLVAALSVGLLLAAPGALRAQGDALEAACAGAIVVPSSACLLATATARTIQSRVGLALFGGDPVPGTASTLGMRTATFPRISVSARAAVTPISLPPLLTLGAGASTAYLPSASGQASVALLRGFSPLPTVGGVLSLDLIGRASYARLPAGKGFREGGVAGWSAGVRLGALRESLTLPGLSVTATYGHAGSVAFGDPDAATTGGYVVAPISDLGASVAMSRHVGRLGIAAGAAVDRYRGNVSFGYRSFPGAALVPDHASATTKRWAAFASAVWSGPITRFSLEAGWQQTPEPEGLPAGTVSGAAGWWTAAAFRLII